MTNPMLSSDLLKKFVSEAEDMLLTGINILERCIPIEFTGFICEAAARAFIACTITMVILVAASVFKKVSTKKLELFFLKRMLLLERVTEQFCYLFN